jgi:hypothetical protein
MKYIISESRIPQLVSAYLDSLNMVITKIDDFIYLSENEGDAHAVLLYNNAAERLWIFGSFAEKLQLIFGLDVFEVMDVVATWIEGFLNVNVDDYGKHISRSKPIFKSYLYT